MIDFELRSEIRNLINCNDLAMFVEMYDFYLHEHQHVTKIEDVIGQIASEASIAFKIDKGELTKLNDHFLSYLEHIAKHPATHHESLNWEYNDSNLIKGVAESWGLSEAKLLLINTLKTHYPTYDINRKDKYDNYTLLMCAVNQDSSDAELVRGLIEAGADIHIESDGNGQAIHFVDHDSPPQLRIQKLTVLLEAGADPELKLNITGFSEKASMLDLAERIQMGDVIEVCKQHINAKLAVKELEYHQAIPRVRSTI